MKKFLLIIFLCACTFIAKTQNTDLPSPSSNLQTLSAGSYVIAMDNTLQTNNSGDFNLKAYGLVVYLLNNNVKIKWVIAAGKAKDGADFSGVAEQVKPALVAGGVSRNFKAGPFVIAASDIAGVDALIDAYYTANSLTGANRPQVYRLTADALNVDIRYNLTGFKPKAAILTDGGNQNLHVAYMTAAGIPTANYTTSLGSDLLSSCYTFASEPHNTNTGTAVNNAIIAIKNFVLNGGNFLAQCEAINNYENNPLGRFQTTSGITISNTNVGTALSYPNPDLSFSQFEGDYSASITGSLKNWKIIGSGTNNNHNHAAGTGTNSTVIGASVSKLASGTGGLVFYLGNHTFATNTTVGINGIRMYMNALLTPANVCPGLQFQSPLPVKLIGFSAAGTNSKIYLRWAIAENETAQTFEIEKSLDGKSFTTSGIVFGTDKQGTEQYSFSEIKPGSKTFYRLKMIDRQGKIGYSKILSVYEKESLVSNELNILANPVVNDLAMDYKSLSEQLVTINIYNTVGGLVYSSKKQCFAGSNQIVVPGQFIKEKATYIIEVTDGNANRITAKAVKI